MFINVIKVFFFFFYGDDRQRVIKYSTFVPMQLTFVGGFAVYQSNCTFYVCCLITFVLKAGQKIVFHFTGKKNKKKTPI